MDELEESARICREKGFARPASMLLAYSGGVGRAFAIVQRHYVYEGSAGYWFCESEGLPTGVFLDREAAERRAEARNIEAFRNILPFHAEDFAREPPWPNDEEIEAKIGEILGEPFRLPPSLTVDEAPGTIPTVFPATLTDEQMRRIVDLFQVKFFVVEEVEIARPVESAGKGG